MPNRIIRAELLESEAWLAIKDNVDRVAWIACFLTVDNLGNMPAGPHRLVKLWRHFGVDTPEKATKVLNDLSDVDLIRLYQADEKPYLHIPRFGQDLRYIGPVWPLSPWNSDEEKQRVEKKSQSNHERTHVNHREPPYDVDVDVDVDVDERKKDQEQPNKPLQRGRAKKCADPLCPGEDSKVSRGAVVWQAYAKAYFARYGTEPVRNAKTNALCKNLVDRIGEYDAPEVAAWFVQHRASWYVQKGHSMQCLVGDAEKLRTEWATGREVTTRESRQVDNGGGLEAQIRRLGEWDDNRRLKNGS